MTTRSLRLWTQIGSGIAEHVRQYIGERDAKIAALEKRIAALESRPALSYEGVYATDKVYSRGMFCTDAGSIWHCRAVTTSDRPGTSSDWQLAVKHGRDLR
jgi:hypothetical protein